MVIPIQPSACTVSICMFRSGLWPSYQPSSRCRLLHQTNALSKTMITTHSSSVPSPRLKESRASIDKQSQGTARYHTALQLGSRTVTQKNGALPTEDPANLTLVYPTIGVASVLPWIFLMPGANCYSHDYTFLETQLASRGYLVAVLDQLHPVTPSTNFVSPVREPQCPCQSWGAVTASALNDTYNFLAATSKDSASLAHRSTIQNAAAPTLPEEAQSALQSLKLDSVVMLGHSLGAHVGCLMLTGMAESQDSDYCSNYSKILDHQGQNILKGLIAFEGSAANLAATFPAIRIPDSTFLTYMSASESRSCDHVKQAFKMTAGQHVQHVQLSSGNHYAITDWNPVSAPHQQAPCGLDNGSSLTSTTQAEQEERLLYIARVTDATIRTRVLRDSAAASYLEDLLRNSNVAMLKSQSEE